MPRGGIDDGRMDLIGEHPGTGLLHDVGEGQQFGLGADLADRIVRIAQDERRPGVRAEAMASRSNDQPDSDRSIGTSMSSRPVTRATSKNGI